MSKRTPGGKLRAAAVTAAVALLLPLLAATTSTAQPVASLGAAPAKAEKVRAVIGNPEKSGPPRDITNQLIKQREARGAKADVTALDCKLNSAVFDRTRSCSYWLIPVTYYVNEQLVGTARLHAKSQATLETRNRYDWKQKVSLKLTNPTTPLAYVSTFKVNFDCKACDLPPDQQQLLLVNKWHEYDFTMKLST